MTTYKLQTQFRLFRFNALPHKTPIAIEWFIYDESKEDDEARCFTYEELQQFQDYAVQNTVNFPANGKNYHAATDDDAPVCNLISQTVPDDSLHFPKNIILRRKPEISTSGVMHCMDIILLNEAGEDNHRYDLPFDVIGRIWR